MTSTGIRVLVLTSLFPQSPGEKQGNFVLDQVRALVAQGAEVTVLVARPWVPAPMRTAVSTNKRPIDPAVYSGERFRVVNADFFSLPRFVLGAQAARFMVKLVGDIRRIQQEWGIDVIHAHGFVLGHAAVAASEELRIPAVITVHGIETAERFDNSPEKREQIDRMLEKTDRIVLVGSPLIEYIRRYTPTTEHCVVVGNGFTAYSGLEASTRLPRQKPVRVIAVSNYEPSKGFELLIEGIGMLEPEVRNQVETVLVGGGEEFSKLSARAKELGLRDQVHYLGPLLHREAMAEVLAVDVFCLPSWKEAFGIMYAEAMALGKFTIGCDGQGPSDFIRHLETGYLMAPRSKSAVTEAIRWAVLHSDEARRIAESGQNFAFGHLTWGHNASRILEIYRESLTTRAKVG